MYLPDGTFSVLEVPSLDVSMSSLMDAALERRKRLSRVSENPRIKYEYLIEKKAVPGVALDKDSILSGHDTNEFFIVRANSRRPNVPVEEEEVDGASAPKTTVQDAEGGSSKLKLKHTFSVLEAPVGYKEYSGVTLLPSGKMRAKADVVLALSEEKVEVHPLKQQAATASAVAKLWKQGSKPKPASYAADSLVACDVLERKANGRCVVRLTMANALATESEDQVSTSLPKASTSKEQQFEYKRHDFECSETDAVEVSF